MSSKDLIDFHFSQVYKLMDDKDDLQARKLILWHLRRISELTDDYEVKKSVMRMFSELTELKEIEGGEGKEEVEEAEEIQVKEEVSGPKCPKCEGKLAIRSSDSGFYAECLNCNRIFCLGS